MIIVLNLKERPDLTDRYPAIDGIRKPDRDFSRHDMGGTSYTPAEEPIRPDIAKLLLLSEFEFKAWYEPRHNATERLLDQWRLFGSIPHLSYGASRSNGDCEYTMTAATAISTIVENLEKGLDYLTKIKERWAEANHHQSQ